MLTAPDQFIPMQAGQSYLMKSQTALVNNLLGNVGYEVKDGYVIFTEDIISTKAIYYVDMQLVVLDMSKYSDYDILPLPADMAAKVVIDCFNIFKQQLPRDSKNDSVSEQPIQIR